MGHEASSKVSRRELCSGHGVSLQTLSTVGPSKNMLLMPHLRKVAEAKRGRPRQESKYCWFFLSQNYSYPLEMLSYICSNYLRTSSSITHPPVSFLAFFVYLMKQVLKYIQLLIFSSIWKNIIPFTHSTKESLIR